MPLIHQHNGLDFFIESDFQEPPYICIKKGKGFIIIGIGIPEEELPYIEKYKNVTREDLETVFDIVNDNQEKFLNAWRKIHNLRNQTKGAAHMSETRMVFKPKVKKEKIKTAIDNVFDKRFIPLQKNILIDAERSDFYSIGLKYYLRLCGWSHTGGSYLNTMIRVREMCKIIFGYEIPEKIGKFNLKDYRYRVIDGSQIIAKAVLEFHKKQLSKF